MEWAIGISLTVVLLYKLLNKPSNSPKHSNPPEASNPPEGSPAYIAKRTLEEYEKQKQTFIEVKSKELVNTVISERLLDLQDAAEKGVRVKTIFWFQLIQTVVFKEQNIQLDFTAEVTQAIAEAGFTYYKTQDGIKVII